MSASSDPSSRPVSPKPPARRPFWRLLRWGAGGLIVLALLVVGNWWLMEGRWLESTDNAYVQGDIAVLSPRIDGDVIGIDVADNQAVRAGASLIRLDPADWQARLDQARATQAQADAAVLAARQQVEPARTAIATADAAIAAAQAQLVYANAEAGRSATLTGAGWTSRSANDQAVADQHKAVAQMATARAQRDSAVQSLSVAETGVAQAEATAQAAAAAEKLAANNLSYTTIRAPFDGVAGNRAAELGAHVTAGQNLIAVAPMPDKLYVVANFKETQLARMRPGQRVVLTPDIDPDAAVNGHVDSLAPATGALFSLLPPENATGNFTKIVQRVPVKLVINPAEAAQAHWLRAGLSVTAVVDTRPGKPVRLGMLGALAARLGLR